MPDVSEKTNGFNVFLDGSALLGIADVELPEVEYMTDSIKGAGISGEYDAPIVGQIGPMNATLNFRNTTLDFAKLAGVGPHQLEIKASVQRRNADGSGFVHVPHIITLLGSTVKWSAGKYEVGASQDAVWEGSITYYKNGLEGDELIEIDKVNTICVINGEDVLADIRANMGM